MSDERVWEHEYVTYNIGAGHPLHRGGEFTDVLVYLNRTSDDGHGVQDLIGQFTGMWAKRYAQQFVKGQ
jgi:hypothetical protein